MRKNIILFCLVVLVFVCALYVCGDTTRYNRNGVVVSHESASVAVVEDESGHLWTFETKEWIPTGMKLVMTMDTNGTEHYIYDDEIVSIYFYFE